MKRLLALALIAPLAACSSAPAPTPTATPSTPIVAATTTGTTTTSPSAMPANQRLLTFQGVGELRVGMTVDEGKRLGLATDDAVACATQITDEASRRYPNVWSYWNASGLQGLAVVGKTDPGQTPHAGEYATAAGIRVGATWAQVKAAYPAAVDWPSDVGHWAGINDVSLPFVGAKTLKPLDGLLVREGDRALVFLGANEVVENLMVTTIDGQSLTRVIRPC